MLLGFDGMTKNKPINMTRWAAESIEQIAYVSYFLASLISVTVSLMDQIAEEAFGRADRSLALPASNLLYITR